MKRSAIYITWSSDVKEHLDAIAAFIIAMAPNHPLFPRPLRPYQRESSEYDAGQVVEVCAHMLAQHIENQAVSDDALKVLIAECIETSKDAEGAVNLVKANPNDDHVADLTAIAEHMQTLVTIARATTRFGINLKFPQDLAILYAYRYIQRGE